MENRIDNYDAVDIKKNYLHYMLINAELLPVYSETNKETVMENLRNWDDLNWSEKIITRTYITMIYRNNVPIDDRVNRELVLNRLQNSNCPLDMVKVKLFSKVETVRERTQKALSKWLEMHGVETDIDNK